METIKTGAVVIVMLGVLYGVFVALNKPEPAPPGGFTQQQVDSLAPPQVQIAPLPPAAQEVVVSPPPAAPAWAEPASPADRSARNEPYQAANSVYATPATPETPPNTTIPAPAQPSPVGATQRSAYESPIAPPVEQPAPAAVPATPPAAASPVAQSAALTAYSFRQDWQKAEQQIAAGKFRDALAVLSPYYNHPDLASEEQAQLTAWLDALAGKVIYSTEHLLAGPFTARGGKQTLFDIAEEHKVPSDLLLNINRAVVNDPLVVLPGTVLKVVPGPFRAEISLTSNELTLFLGELYAGRFPITLGDEPPLPGEHVIIEKRTDRTYYGVDRTILANDPSNPYGGFWLDLGREVCIHGSPTSAAGTPTLGCVSLSPQDARDVYGILSRGSSVIIKR